MNLRDATERDVPQISAFLKELTAAGKRTRPDDEAFVLAHYINDPAKIRCTVAEEDGEILGFQSLSLAEDGNQWGVTPGWGIIGTHIRLSAARRGVGRALFSVTRAAAAAAGISDIDASIGADNAEGLGYYEAIGFRAYRSAPGRICKRFEVS